MTDKPKRNNARFMGALCSMADAAPKAVYLVGLTSGAVLTGELSPPMEQEEADYIRFNPHPGFDSNGDPQHMIYVQLASIAYVQRKQ